MILKLLLLFFYFLIDYFCQGIDGEFHLLDFLAVEGLQKLSCLLEFFEVNFLCDSFDDGCESDGFCEIEFVEILDDLLCGLDFLPGHGFDSDNAIIELQLGCSILFGILFEIDLVAFWDTVDCVEDVGVVEFGGGASAEVNENLEGFLIHVSNGVN